MNINIEYKHETGFKNFFNRIAGKKLSVLYDVNTKPYAEALLLQIKEYTKKPFAWNIPIKNCFRPKTNANGRTNFQKVAIMYWLSVVERSTIWRNPFLLVWE